MAGRNRGTRAKEFRREMKSQWQSINQACGICGQADIDWDGERNQPNSFELDHRLALVTHPHLEFDPMNAVPSHCRCNRAKGAGQQQATIGTTSEVW